MGSILAPSTQEDPILGSHEPAATWSVEDVDGLARDLKGKGVRFERYEFPNCTHEGDVHVMGSHRVAWFKDPEGNIHSLVNG